MKSVLTSHIEWYDKLVSCYFGVFCAPGITAVFYTLYKIFTILRSVFYNLLFRCVNLRQGGYVLALFVTPCLQ